MRVIGIIPVRMQSSRLPGKPLANIHGIPMVGHVYHRCKLSQQLNAVYIATCDESIARYAQSIGAPCIMTSNTHQRASDRVAEALLSIENNTGEKAEIIVMVQGDEPMVCPQMIDEAIQPLLVDTNKNVVNLMAELISEEEFEDPNEVKVVVNLKQEALYFSREPIPSRKKYMSKVPMYKQVCVIPFRRDYLLEFNQLSETPLEIVESVDMMRILEHGGKVHMVKTKQRTLSVDTSYDLERVIQLMKNDSLLSHYAKMREAETL